VLFAILSFSVFIAYRYPGASPATLAAAGTELTNTYSDPDYQRRPRL
jgi:hypothetical protein